MTQVIDKEALKEALRELIKEEPNLLNELKAEAENATKEEELPDTSQDFEKAMEKNFKRFDATFKALA